jgi:protein-S-isoprenylcysteine O-methyltransferase Ste14
VEFTAEERQTYSKLLKEPISVWMLALCFVGIFVLYSSLINYVGWTWLRDLKMELPLIILWVLASSRIRITQKEKELLHKISSEHRDLTDEI